MTAQHTVPQGWAKGALLQVWPLERQEWSNYEDRSITVNKDRWRVMQAPPDVCPIGRIKGDEIGMLIFDSRGALDDFLKWWNE